MEMCWSLTYACTLHSCSYSRTGCPQEAPQCCQVRADARPCCISDDLEAHVQGGCRRGREEGTTVSE
jgi:hypothetical protein